MNEIMMLALLVLLAVIIAGIGYVCYKVGYSKGSSDSLDMQKLLSKTFENDEQQHDEKCELDHIKKENAKLRELVRVTDASWVATLDYPDSEADNKLGKRKERLRIELGLPVTLIGKAEELSKELGFEVRP